MIGLLILVIGVGYYYLSKFIIKNTYEKYGTKKAKYIATAIMVLIPTWDIVLGYPIYAFLCLTNSGVKIYQSVDNVDGFYVGELDANYPYSPYKGYRYMDYKGEKSDKYYRNYWIDNNTSELCIPIGKHIYGDYAKAFEEGKCIVKKEISKSEISQWEWNTKNNIYKNIVPILGIDTSTTAIHDRKNNVNIAESIGYSLDSNWFWGNIRNITSSKGVFASCGSTNGMLENTLKPKKGEN